MKKIVIGMALLGWMQSCQSPSSENASLTFSGAFFSDEEAIAGFLEKDHPEPSQSFDTAWAYLGADSVPGIFRELPEFKEFVELDLPHRIQAPNHSLWYRKKVMLEPGILIIDGDDSAQLWVDRTRISRADSGEYFLIERSGEQEITIRVVNNAMAGGLRRVHWVAKSEFEAWQCRRKVRLDSLQQVRKVEMLQDSELIAGLKGLDFPAQNELLKSYPILLAEPVLILGTDQTWFVRWVSEVGGSAHLIFENGEKLELQSRDGIFTLPMEEASLRFSMSQQNSNFGSFEFSLPKKKEKIKLALWGDSQGGWTYFDQVSRQIETHQVDLSIGAGDLVNNGSEEYAYPRFLQKLSLMKAAQLPVPGNHDYDGWYEDLNPRFLRQYVFRPEEPTYGVQYLGSLAVLTLDPNENFPVSIPEKTAQRELLERVLESEDWKKSPWKMLVLHQPPYSQGWPGYEGELSIRELLEPYFHRGLIDLVVAGHTHDYERLKMDFLGHSVQFLIVGGAGGGLEPEGKNSEKPVMDLIYKKHHFGIMELDAKQIDWKVYGLQGEVMDELIIRK